MFEMDKSKIYYRSDFICKSLTEIDHKLYEQLKNVIIRNDTNEEEIFLITSADDVYGFGSNYSGKLGFGHNNKVNEPTIIPELCGKSVFEIKCGETFSVVLTEAGDIYTYGSGSRGTIGSEPFHGCTFSKPKKLTIEDQLVSGIDCSKYCTHVVTKTGQLYWFGNFGDSCDQANTPTKVDFSCGNEILSVSCGTGHVLALTTNVKVFSLGYNFFGQLGLGHRLAKFKPQMIVLEDNIFIKQISAGSYHSILLTSDGYLYSMGGDISGINNTPQLIHLKFKIKEICCFGETSMATDITDRVYVWGIYFKKIIKSPKLTNFHSFQEVINDLDHYNCSLRPLNKEQIFIKNPLEKVPITILKFFNNPENSDLKFKLKLRGSSNQYEYIYGHKFILVEFSEYFKKILSKNCSESETNVIEITDFSYEAFFQYIHCIYNDYIQTKELELLLELLSITEQYLDPNTKDKCEEQIKRVTTLQNVCTVFSCAIKNRSDYLRQFSLDMISENKKEMLDEPDYNNLDPIYTKELLTAFITNNF